MADGGPTRNVRRDLTRTVLAVLLMADSHRRLVLDLAAVPARDRLGGDDRRSDVADDDQAAARLRSRALAVMIMSGTMVLVFVVPLVLAIQALVENADTISEWLGTLATASIPPPPEWLSRIPLVGAKIAERWASIAAGDKEDLVARLAPHLAAAAQWLASALGGFGAGLPVSLDRDHCGSHVHAG